MGIESGAAAFLSGFASTYGREQSLESKALERIKFEESEAGIRFNQHQIQRRVETDLAQRAGVNKGLKEVKIGNILEHRKLQGDETLLSDLVPFLQKQSYLQVNAFYNRVNDKQFSGFLHVGKDQDYANSEAVKYGNMEIIFDTPLGAYYGHAPDGQGSKVKMSVMDISARINTAKNTLQKENPNMLEDELTNKAYELGFNSASLDNQTLFTQYNTTFTGSIDTLIKDTNMKSIFVTPDSFASQMRIISVLQAKASSKGAMAKDVRKLKDETESLEIQLLTRASKREIYTPQQYTKAMRKLFSPYMSKAAILGSANQRDFMKNQLSDPKMEDRLFKILKRLYPKQNTPPKTKGLTPTGDVKLNLIERTGARDTQVGN
jgi:hypothetical protein